MLLCMLEAVEGRLCLLEVLDVLEEPEVMRCMLLCLIEEAIEVSEAVEASEVMHCLL